MFISLVYEWFIRYGAGNSNAMSEDNIEMFVEGLEEVEDAEDREETAGVIALSYTTISGCDVDA